MSGSHIKVVKFGGSSLADARRIRAAADIVKADPERRYVVPSAPGKRWDGDIKVTDMLYTCVELAGEGRDYSEELYAVFARFNEIISELGLDLDLSADYARIEAAVRRVDCTDYIACRGEFLNGRILAEYLGFEFVDAAETVFFTDSGKYDAERTDAAMSGRLRDCERAVVPGFYGSLPNGRLKTFSRGGSDVTGSIVAKAVHADLYENWTDVPGFLMADPGIVPDPKVIRTLTYRELRELAYMGATVMHEDAVFPARQSGIPINIKNIFDPSAPGTMIVASAGEPDDGGVLTGIAGKKGFCIITMEKEMMNAEVGFGRRVLSVLERYNMNFEHIPTGIDSLCLVVNEHELAGREKQVLDEVMLSVHPDMIRIERGVAVIAVVGRGMKSSIGTAAKLFGCIAAEGINIRMIDQGSSELNIVIAVEQSHFEQAVRAIYRAFVN